MRRQSLLWVLGIIAGVVLVRLRLWPARIRGAQVQAVSTGRPSYADVAWSYGRGVRPDSVIIDLKADNGAAGSLTADGETISGAIPVTDHFGAGYTLVVTATYRILGTARTVVRQFTGTI